MNYTWLLALRAELHRNPNDRLCQRSRDSQNMRYDSGPLGDHLQVCRPPHDSSPRL